MRIRFDEKGTSFKERVSALFSRDSGKVPGGIKGRFLMKKVSGGPSTKVQEGTEGKGKTTGGIVPGLRFVLGSKGGALPRSLLGNRQLFGRP